jgi:hypothetical protein
MKTKVCPGHVTGEIPRAVGDLPSSQGGEWRHICSACAYLLGRRHAEETEHRLRDRIRLLEASQAPTVGK